MNLEEARAIAGYVKRFERINRLINRLDADRFVGGIELPSICRDYGLESDLRETTKRLEDARIYNEHLTSVIKNLRAEVHQLKFPNGLHLTPDEIELIEQGKVIDAIRHVRDRIPGTTLVDAKAAVDAHRK